MRLLRGMTSRNSSGAEQQTEWVSAILTSPGKSSIKQDWSAAKASWARSVNFTSQTFRFSARAGSSRRSVARILDLRRVRRRQSWLLRR